MQQPDHLGRPAPAPGLRHDAPPHAAANGNALAWILAGGTILASLLSSFIACTGDGDAPARPDETQVLSGCYACGADMLLGANVRIDVSQAFGAANGLSVYQITTDHSLPAGDLGIPQDNYLTYYDIPAFDPGCGRLTYNNYYYRPNDDGTGQAIHHIMTAARDGTGATATSSCANAKMSSDGRLTLFGCWIAKNTYRVDGYSSGSCQRTLVDAGYTNPTINPATFDPRAGRYLFPINYGTTIQLALEDGTGPGGSASPSALALPDAGIPDGGSPGFHRVRLNPRFPHLLFYRWEGSNEIVIFDSRMNRWSSFDMGASSHPMWHPDGTRIGAANGAWVEWTVANRNGTLVWPITKSAGIGPFGQSGVPPIFYGSYSRDGRYLAVSTSQCNADAGTTVGRIYLLDLQTGAATRLCDAHNDMLRDAGACDTQHSIFAPVLHILDDNKTIVFQSNYTGRTQLYLIEGLASLTAAK